MSSTAIVTTTINVPTVLEKYATLPENPRIIVAGDMNTPQEAVEYCHLMGFDYLSLQDQQDLAPGVSELVGWRCIQRRNLAILAAGLSPGIETIVTVDDDNAPMNDWYVADHLHNLYKAPDSWAAPNAPSHVYNPGAQLVTTNGRKWVMARGLPYDDERHLHAWNYTHEVTGVDAAVGVSAGLWLGDPDIDAMDRMCNRPEAVSMRNAVALAPGAYAPINSQNTAWRAGLGVLMGCLPGVGRYDDIWGSYVACKVMADLGYGIVFGDPLVRQDRNPHDLSRDVEQEVYGYRYTPHLLDLLRAAPRYEGSDVVGAYRHAVKACAEVLPSRTIEFADAWASAWEGK